MISFRFVLLLVFLWLLVQAWSFWAPTNIEGPRNIDTGFRRLDIWFRWQLVALGIAIISSAAGLFTIEKRWRDRIVGLTPLGLTVLIAAGIFFYASYGPGSKPINNSSSVTGSP